MATSVTRLLHGTAGARYGISIVLGACLAQIRLQVCYDGAVLCVMALYCGVLGFCLKLAACRLPVANGACNASAGLAQWRGRHGMFLISPHSLAPTIQ
jgi:hypothetical protein